MFNKFVKAFRIIFHFLINNSKGIVFIKEYISHDFTKNLSPSSENKQKALLKITSDLHKLKIDYSISKGTLLGLSRNNKFIKNDIDIDIDIFSEKNIFELIKLTKFDVFRTINFNGRLTNIVLFDRENKMLIDIAIYLKYGNFYINHFPKGEFILNENLVKSISYKVFNNISISSYISEDYLSLWYGKDWKKPKPYTKDWIIHYKESCSALKYYDRLSLTIDVK
jgi:hypothetical protein